MCVCVSGGGGVGGGVEKGLKFHMEFAGRAVKVKNIWPQLFKTNDVIS